MEIFDNINTIVKTDLDASIKKGSRLSIAAACFSMYAYQALRKQLDGIDELRFSQIIWQNKISPTTTNVKAGERVQELEVIVIELNQRSLDTKVLSQIDKEIPYHLLCYKEASQAKTGTFKPGVYFHAEWTSAEDLPLKLSGLNMDAVYESYIRQIAGERLEVEYDVKEDIDRDMQRQKLQREIATPEKKIQSEKQFNRQVELNAELKILSARLGKKC